MAAPIFIHGKTGLFSFNGTLFNALDITFEETTTVEDITYTVSGSATYQTVIPGYRKGACTVTFVYDTANQPCISPFDMRPGFPITGNVTQTVTIIVIGNPGRMSNGLMHG